MHKSVDQFSEDEILLAKVTENLGATLYLEGGRNAAHEARQVLLTFLRVVRVLDVDQHFMAQSLRQIQVAHRRICQIDLFLKAGYLLLQVFCVDRKETKQHIVNDRAEDEQGPGEDDLVSGLRDDLTDTKGIERGVEGEKVLTDGLTWVVYLIALRAHPNKVHVEHPLFFHLH